MIETREAILPLQVALEVIIIQEGHTEEETITEMEVTIDTRGLEANLYPQLEDFKVASTSPSKDKDR